MPIFDYECNNCKLVIERLVSNPDITCNCDICGDILVRLIGAPTFQFKGYGFPGNDMKRRKARGDLEL